MRNQNVYAARVTQGLHVAAPGNAKPLGRIQRAFVVVAANDTFVAKTFRMSIASQPSGGSASFRQFATLTQLDLTIGPRSSVSRTVYVRSTDSRASVKVDVRETSNGAVVPLLLGGLQGSTILNPDLMNPDLMNPDLMNPDMTSADVMNAEVYTPDLMNPDLMNPDLMNPDLMNPDLMNPDLMNPDLMNPDLMNPDLMNPGEVNVSLLNPDLMNPDLMNPDLMNGAFSDTVWTLTNNGNTTAAYDVRLVLRTPVPEGFSTQLLLYKTYLTPVARDCKLTQETQNVLVASIPSPRFDAPSAPLVSDPADGSLQHATLWLAPGETGKVALRVLDPDQTDNVTFNPMVAVTTAVAPQAVDTESAAAGETTPDVVKSSSLGFLGRPSDTPIGGYVDPPVEVLVRDEAGATVMGAAVVLSLVSNPGGATLHGAAATSGEDGVARFDQLWLDRLGTGYRLRATAGTLVSDGGGSFDVVPLVVTSANDAGPGSLRAALENANRNVGYADSITFGIGAGPVVISPSSALPAVTDPVTIDGTTQGGYAGTPLVRLDGASAGTGVHGLSVQASATTIRGLAITRFAGAGIRLDGASGSVVEDSYTGTDGVADLGNGGDGVVIMSGSANEVRRCVISGNDANGIVLSQTSGNRVRGSLIGTNAAGEAAVGNQYAGVYVHTNASANVIGGPDAADMNVISGNGTGLDLVSGAHHNFIQGNRIGTNKAGTAAVGNTGSHGIGVYHDDNEVRGNLISGNTATGLRLDIGHRTLVEGNSIGTDVTGTAAVPNGIGITFANFGSAEHTIRGNLVSGNTGDGIQLLNADHFTIAGNKVGTTAAGTAALPNGSRGIAIYGCVGTTIGGSGPGAGNLVSGNLVTGLALEPLTTAVHYGLVDCVVEGNVVGTDLSGSSRLANGGSGITITAGSAPDAPMSGIVIRGNLLSGNAGDGLVVTQGVHHLTASGNTIGTDLGGALAIPNARHGIYVADGVHDIEIGSGNLISGNAGFGVFLVSPDVPTQNNVVSGNLIGTNRAGTLSVGNLIGVALGGVGIRSNRVAGNVASGNALYGVALTGDTHDNTVVGNKIGTNAAGTGALPNLQDGLYVGGTSDLIGGSGAGEGNLISGNGGAGVFIQGGSGNRVRGNWIGLDASGLSALGNAVAGVSIASLSTVSNIIGGPNPGDGNVISGNPLGVSVPGAGAQIIEGNRVGTNPAGDAAIGNTGDGIFFGSAEGVVIRANLVSGNGGCGIVGSGNSAQITGNNVGTNLAGTSALGNTSSGICVGNGSGFSIRDNLVSGNLANGVWAAQATATTIAANRIGTDAAGTSAVPNQLDGVYVTGSGVSLIGGPAAADGNTIAFNLGKGIGYGGWFGGSAFGSNRIFSNGGLGIDLGDSGVTPNDTGDGDTGPNELQNFPVLTSAIASGGSTTVSGTLNTFPGTFTIQFFSSSACDPSGYGEGELLEGSTLVATDAEGYSSYSVVLPRDLSGRGVTATATASTIAVGSRTSEFSACVPVLP
jgi:parallel beta-helix repeat protein